MVMALFDKNGYKKHKNPNTKLTGSLDVLKSHWLQLSWQEASLRHLRRKSNPISKCLVTLHLGLTSWNQHAAFFSLSYLIWCVYVWQNETWTLQGLIRASGEVWKLKAKCPSAYTHSMILASALKWWTPRSQPGLPGNYTCVSGLKLSLMRAVYFFPQYGSGRQK